MDKTYETMEYIFKLLGILSVTNVDIKDAFGERWKDFEDCVQYTTAKNNQIKYIVTENARDFNCGDENVMTPQEFVIFMGEN